MNFSRTATYIFLLDCQYVACFRSPPLITVAELTGNLPTSEAKFNEEDSLQTTIPPQSPTRSLSLAETMDLLMDDSWCGVENPLFQKNSIFGLFAVICGKLTASCLSLCLALGSLLSLPDL